MAPALLTLPLPLLAGGRGEGNPEDLQEEAAEVEPAVGGPAEAAGGPPRRGGDARHHRSGPPAADTPEGVCVCVC